jgi:hypothetical protein
MVLVVDERDTKSQRVTCQYIQGILESVATWLSNYFEIASRWIR